MFQFACMGDKHPAMVLHANQNAKPTLRWMQKGDEKMTT